MDRMNVIEANDFTFEQTIKEAIEYNLRARIEKPCAAAYSTGYIDFDELTGGIRPGELTIIAGRPAIGKTSFCLNIVQHMALHDNRKIGFFSILEEAEKIANMLLAMEANVDIKHVETGLLSEYEKERVSEAAQTLYGSEILYNSSSYGRREYDLDDLFMEIARYVWGENVEIIVIDALQYICLKDNNALETIVEVVKTLRNLAIAAGIPIILISNLPNSIDGREDKHPLIQDLSTYGPIEKYADTIIFLYRDDYYNPNSIIKGIVDINVAYSAGGENGNCQLLWTPQVMKYYNLEKGH